MVHNYYEKYTMKHIKYPPKNPNKLSTLYVLSLQNKCVKTYYMYIRKRKTLINTDTLIITYSKQVNIDSNVYITLAERGNL